MAAALVVLHPVVPAARRVAFERRRLLDNVQISLTQEMNRDFEGRTGLRIAMPLLDPDVVEHLYRLPPGCFVSGGKAKAPARKVLSRHLGSLAGSWPQTVFANSLWADAVRTEGRRAWEFVGDVEALSGLGLVDPVGVEQALIDPSPATPLRDLTAAWRAVTFEGWVRRAFAAKL